MTEPLPADILADPPPQRPEPPGPNECCQSGCDPCVLDLYAEELQQYRETLRQWQARHPEANQESQS
ncbi:oxidoreductase-like domain-containing protein [Corticimicrobacter populi]|uniref:Oxidoreductase-like protein n=1 Tax=Corticimicrobacter populi TaxID=2175229 RepID=A0A2V1K116_9BURK|nr:oxidoreductase-like domain-containing protein [Corticimicrobacter populi]PWF22945.1 oxidoreductase-like protein [Corticimicrobacter populi]